MTTFSPLATLATITSSRPASTVATSLEVEPVCAATAEMRSVLVRGTVSPSSLEATTMHDPEGSCVHLCAGKPPNSGRISRLRGPPGDGCAATFILVSEPLWRPGGPADRLLRRCRRQPPSRSPNTSPTARSRPRPVVVLVHGSLDRSASFARVLRRLDDLHTVVYDRRGYHRSRQVLPLNSTLDGHVDDLLAVIDGRSAVVVGHSYGGDIALGAALRGGGSTIAAVAAYEPPMPWLDVWPRSARAATVTSPPGPPTRSADTDEAAAERFFRRMVGDAAWERLPEEDKRARRADGAGPGRRARCHPGRPRRRST